MTLEDLKNKLSKILGNADEAVCLPCSHYKIRMANSTAFLLVRCGIDPTKLKFPGKSFGPLVADESTGAYKWTNCFALKEFFAAIEAAVASQDARFED